MEIRQGEDGTIFVSGHVTSENADEFMTFLCDNAEGTEVTIDCLNLTYVSSAGLRVFVKIMLQGKKLRLVNVNPDVYETLRVTGLAGRMEVRHALRKVSVEGLPLIGTGATADVYRLDDDKVIKVFRPWVSRAVIDQEQEITRQAFLSGIDTMAAYGLVTTEKGLASVFENAGGHTLLQHMKEDHGRIQQLITSFGHFVREQHRKMLDSGRFGSAKVKTMEILRQYDRLGISRDVSERLVSMVEKVIPETEEFSHGDCHAGNVMMRDGSFVFIDVGRMGRGHVIYDLISMFLIYRSNSFHHMGEDIISPLAKEFSAEERMLIWNSYLRAVTGIRDEELIQKAETQISMFTVIRLLEARYYVRNFVPDAIYEFLIKEVLAYEAQGAEPLFF